MTRITCDMAMSVDGFVAGPRQSADNPFGEGVNGRLHRWMFEEPEAHTAVMEAMTSASAFIMGRNMFGPGRGEWDADEDKVQGQRIGHHCQQFGKDALPQHQQVTAKDGNSPTQHHSRTSLPVSEINTSSRLGSRRQTPLRS